MPLKFPTLPGLTDLVKTRPISAGQLPLPIPDIQLPDKLGRAPTANDLIINRTFDGLTLQAAVQKIKANFQGTVSPHYTPLVDETLNARVRNMQAVLNNVFTPKTPNNRCLTELLPADITILSSLSSLAPVVYQVRQLNQEPKNYILGRSGVFEELAQLPKNIVMQAKVTLEPVGLLMTYPAWNNRSLSEPGGAVITEL